MKRTYRYATILAFLTALILIPVITFYPATTQVSVDSETSDAPIVITEPITEPETSISYSPDGKGYLKAIGTDKYLLHVEGSPWQMGYQHGYLLAEGVSKMASDETFKQILLGFVGMDKLEARAFLNDILSKGLVKDLLGWLISGSTIDKLYATLGDILDIIIEIIRLIISYNKRYVPYEFRTEMSGIAAGARARGKSVTFNDVLLLNLGIDALLSFVYPIVTPILPFAELLGFHMCDGFVAYDDATYDGRTIMGRNFMFNPYGFKDYALLIEQKPNSGYKFVSVTAPAFVGVTAAMNTKGIGIGMDMVPAMDCTPGKTGMGCVLTARKAIQYSYEMSKAVSTIKYSTRGVSWIYIIGDGKTSQRGGVAVEVSAKYCYTRYTSYTKPWYLPDLGYPQIETKDDLLILANHFIRPEANTLAVSYGIEDSRWRYKTLTNLVLNYYGSITPYRGRKLVDYLHPPNYGYYGSSRTQAVGASRTCFDLTDLKLWSLYGHYDDAWAYYRLYA